MQILIFSAENIHQIDHQISQNAKFDGFLFSKTPHLLLQNGHTNQISVVGVPTNHNHFFSLSVVGVPTNHNHFFSLFLEEKNNVYARFNVFFGEENNIKMASSPLKMPFGSIEFSEHLSYENLHFFVNEIQKFCLEKFLETTPSPSFKGGRFLLPSFLRRGWGWLVG